MCPDEKVYFSGHPDKKDASRFDSKTTYPQKRNFKFERLPENQLIKVNDWTSDLPEFNTLQELCENHEVRELLIIKKDTILFNYKNKLQEELHSSYSMSKCVVSCLIGMAIDDGFLQSEHQYIKVYLPELIQNKYSNQLQIKHLLNHTSGIKNSLAMDGRIYYGNDIYKEIEKIRLKCAPGEQQEYLNINYIPEGINNFNKGEKIRGRTR